MLSPKAHGKPLNGSTINRRVTALSAVLSVTVKEYGWLAKNLVWNVSRLEDSKGRVRFLGEQERFALLEACDASTFSALGSAVRLALATGARKGELHALAWQNVDLDRRTVRFVDTKNGSLAAILRIPHGSVRLDWRHSLRMSES